MSIPATILPKASSASPFFGGRLFPRQFRPLPDAGRDAPRQPLPELANDHAQLPPVVALVRSKVAKEVLHVGREVLPRCSRHAAGIGDSKLDELHHPGAASRQSLHELRLTHTTQVYQLGHLKAMGCTEALDPPAPAVVDVRGNHAHREPRNPRHLSRPHRERQMLDEVRCRAGVRPPRRRPRIGFGTSRHARPFPPILRLSAKHGDELRSSNTPQASSPSSCSAASRIELLSSGQARQLTVERAERQMACPSSNLEHQTVRESDSTCLAELSEGSHDDIGVLDR